MEQENSSNWVNKLDSILNEIKHKEKAKEPSQELNGKDKNTT